MVKALRVDNPIIDEIFVLLMSVVGERGDNEGAVDVVKRLIKESRSQEQIDKIITMKNSEGI